MLAYVLLIVLNKPVQLLKVIQILEQHDEMLGLGSNSGKGQ